MAHPRRAVTRPEVLKKIRSLCLALPETSEKQAWGGPTFRVRDKMFAMYMDNHHGDGRICVWCNSDADARDALISADPARFFVPPYMGPRGWLGVCLDKRLGWKRVTDLVEHAYRRTAPKRLLAELDSR
jgi:hypothetical protein